MYPAVLFISHYSGETPTHSGFRRICPCSICLSNAHQARLHAFLAQISARSALPSRRFAKAAHRLFKRGSSLVPPLVQVRKRQELRKSPNFQVESDNSFFVKNGQGEILVNFSLGELATNSASAALQAGSSRKMGIRKRKCRSD